MGDARDLYLDLMKKCLVNSIYGYAELREIQPRTLLQRLAAVVSARNGMKLVSAAHPNEELRRDGRGWPSIAHSMMGLKRLDNLQDCMEVTLKSNVAGDFIETGVWRGGGTILMRSVLKAYGVKDRLVWVADSFRGVPPPSPDKYPLDAGDNLHTFKELAISLEEVKRNFSLYGLLDEQVMFLEGWFSETLPSAPIEHLALIRLDGDMYESTMDALTNLYPKLSVGGYVIVDDYGAGPMCAKAVMDYREKEGIDDEIIEVDWTGVYWRRAK